MSLRWLISLAFGIILAIYFLSALGGEKGKIPDWLLSLIVVTIITIYFTFFKAGDLKVKLIKAAEKGDIPSVRKMLDKKKAKKVIDKLGANGNRLLHYASGEWKEPDLVEKIIQMGADVNIQNIWKRTPLHTAAEVNNFDAMRILLDHGADIHRQDIHKITPLAIVQKKNKKKTLELFNKYS